MVVRRGPVAKLFGPVVGDQDFDDTWLRKITDTELSTRQPHWHEPRRNFRGSEAGSECERQLTFKLMGHNVPVIPRVKRIFLTGEAIESINVLSLDAAGVLTGAQTELEWEQPVPIKGHLDVKVRHPETGVEYVGDVKSIKQELYDQLPPEHGPVLASESPLMKRHGKYVHQVNMYLTLDGVEIGFLLFEAKNTQHQKYYWLIQDADLAHQDFDIMGRAFIYGGTEPQTLAPRPDTRNPQNQKDYVCAYCDSSYLCVRLAPTATYNEVRELDAKLRG